MKKLCYNKIVALCSVLLFFTLLMNTSIIAKETKELTLGTNNYQQLSEQVEGALKWLMNKTISTENGFKWPCSEKDNESYTSLYEGTPGVCLLFLKAYEVTGNESYLNYARGGMNWLMSMTVKENESCKWPDKENSTVYYTSLYEGAAGVGSTFIDFYKVLDNDTYLKYAEGAAEWLIDIGIISKHPVYGLTCKWPVTQGANNYCIDIMYGSVGTGLFLLKLYEATKNETFLRYAEYAGNWLITEAIHIGGGYLWNNNIYSKIFISPGFSHGLSGIGYFFAELYKVSKKTIYLKYAEGTAREVIREGVFDFKSHGMKWRTGFEKGKLPSFFIFSTGWCYGPTGICELFINLYKITNNSKYLKYSKLGSNWLIYTAIPEDDGYKWPTSLTRFGEVTKNNNDVTICHGAAGIGELFLDMYNLTKESVYLEYANGAAEWLKQVAVKNNEVEYKWETYGECYTGHHVGASGIALFLIKTDSI